ncbi:hypothetical protein ACIQNU_02425 [Streptomyces sp. NPDC091292]|uniref:hypothetical protein n=1 Tax=Streptomyces sp. NPDC091292 TaxID=3365991 RepID=UPI0038218B2F
MPQQPTPDYEATMNIRYVVGTTERTVEVLTGGFSLADHVARLDPRNSGTQWVTFILAAGGGIALRGSAIIAIEQHGND